MKKILSMILVAAMVLGFSTVAFAASDSDGTKAQNRQDKIALMSVREEFLQNRSNILGLRSEIVADRAKIMTELTTLKADKSDISQEKLDAIKGELQKFKDDRAALRQINQTDMKPQLEAYKTDLKNKAFAAAKNDLEAILTIQENKISTLQTIKADTTDLLGVLGQ